MATSRYKQEVPQDRLAEYAYNIMFFIHDKEDVTQKKDAVEFLLTKLSPTGNELSMLSTIVNFISDELRGVGWLVKGNHGKLWQITEDGREAFSKFKDRITLYAECRRLYDEWKIERHKVGRVWPLDDLDGNIWPIGKPHGKYDDIICSPAASPCGVVISKQLAEASKYEEVKERADSEIYDYISKMPPNDFQHLVEDLLTAIGYHVKWGSAKGGPDGGVDILAYKDKLGIGPRVKVQCKRWQKPASRPDLQAFHSTIRDGDIGIYVSTGGFSSDAHRYTREIQERLIPIDMEELICLWIENMGNLSDAARARLPLQPVYMLAGQGDE